MARDFARAFYKSKAWETAREACIRRARGLCEPCLKAGRVVPGEIVHHKVHLTPDNVNDPRISLDQSNLELVCRDCHAKEHPEIYGKSAQNGPRVAFDEFGNVVRL